MHIILRRSVPLNTLLILGPAAGCRASSRSPLPGEVKDLSLAKRTAEAERAQLQALVKSYEAGSGKLSKCLSRLSSVASTATLPSGDRPPLARSARQPDGTRDLRE